jgi:hypothetical protein
MNHLHVGCEFTHSQKKKRVKNKEKQKVYKDI